MIRERYSYQKTLVKVIRIFGKQSQDPSKTYVLLTSRLIPSDKKPGLRPIGEGEVLRRIIGKVVMATLRAEIIDSVGSLQFFLFYSDDVYKE